jgi:GntP family gluconate:H+ symporter
MDKLFAFVIGIVLMMLAISKGKMHPFLAIMAISLPLGLFLGIPLVNTADENGAVTPGIAAVIGAGFSGTFTSIGIVIILGALIGTILETTGGAFKLADMVIKLVGPQHPVLAMQIMGWAVSIPVFCDSGFVILDPIRKALVRRTKARSVSMTVALSSGLYASYMFIPPTPGPIAVATILGAGNNLFLVMVLGLVVSIPALIGAFIYASFIGDQMQSTEDLKTDETARSYRQIREGYGTLPDGFSATAPILLPILLMAFGSIASISHWTGSALQMGTFLGTPIIALSVGLVFAIAQLGTAEKLTAFYEITNETLKIVGPILFITAAGGVLGRIIGASGIADAVADRAGGLRGMGILFPFLLSGALKSVQGSSMVALTTAAGIVAPLLNVLGLGSPARTALTVIAIGAGAMTVSHANDSYFWVVTNFGGMTPAQGYKTQTVATLIEGVCAMIGVLIVSLLLP